MAGTAPPSIPHPPQECHGPETARAVGATPIAVNLNVSSAIEQIRSHILFVPVVMVLLAGLLAVALVELDRHLVAEDVRQVAWIFRAGASGAREVLSTVATAMVQLAAITFSVTIVALALRSQQFGPRLLRNFTGDQFNQVILGTFIGTFAYALLVLRAVRDLDDAALDDETFIPFLAVTFAILLALICLALFVVFIDRVVTSIQANSIVAEAANEARRAMESQFPEDVGDEFDPAQAEDHEPFVGGADVLAPSTGYIQDVDPERLLAIAREADVKIRMEAPIGGFVVKGSPLVTVMPGDRVDEKLVEQVHRAYAVGRYRSTRRDPEFGIRQIVDVAVKALSPSDNDPTTAVTATEYLGALLVDFASRPVPSPLRKDENGSLRVIALGSSFRGITSLALDQIREHGADEPTVVFTLLETIIRVAGAVRHEWQRAILEEHVWKISRAVDREIVEPITREAVNRRLLLAMDRLGRDEANSSHYLLPLAEPRGAAVAPS
jgi:uncharacterized membrane protein